MERSTKWLSQIFDVVILTPKTQNFDFSKRKDYKIQNFGVIKNGLYVVKFHTKNIQTKFQKPISSFLAVQ